MSASHNLLPPLRLVASGGPVSCAIDAGRGENIPEQRDRIRRLADSIRQRIALDCVLIASLERAAARLSPGDLA